MTGIHKLQGNNLGQWVAGAGPPAREPPWLTAPNNYKIITQDNTAGI